MISSGSVDASRSPGRKHKFLSALLHISPTCLLSGLLLATTPPLGKFTSFPEGCGQNPELQLGKKQGALERPSVQRFAFPEVTLVGRELSCLDSVCAEGIPRPVVELWLREFFSCAETSGRWCTFFRSPPSTPSNSKTPRAPEPPAPGKSSVLLTVSLSC